MNRLVTMVAGCVFLVLAARLTLIASAPHPQDPRSTPHTTEATAQASPRAIFDRYCITCHNQKLKTAGLMLDTLDMSKVGIAAPVWEKVVRQLRTGAMPPTGRPRPDAATYDAVATSMEAELDRTAAASPEPGRLPTFQRLTRTEYQNSIRDLLALDDLPQSMNIALLLPADNSGNGFDNLRELLFVSSTQLDQYLSAARKIARLAVGDPETPPFVDTYRVSEELPQDRHIEGTEFGTRGGTVIRTNFPVNGDYGFEIELGGASLGHEFVVNIDGQRARTFTITEPREAKEARVTAESSLKETGSHKFERDQAAARRALLNKGYTTIIPMTAGQHEIAVSFVQHTSARGEEFVRPTLRGRGAQPGIATVTIKGPYQVTGPGDTASRRRLFTCQPSSRLSEERCARQILSTLARRAYRRPATDEDLRELLSFYEQGRVQGGFERGIQFALQRVLVSPQFLFRIESDTSAGPGVVHPVTDLELASRLSFFLWSSIPDDELLNLAVQGRLREPRALEQQVRRMIADPRSHSLVSNFAAQWLYLRDLEAKHPNPRFFYDFDSGLRTAFDRETELFVDSILRQDRSVIDLLDAKHTFVNERLAKHYGIPDVYGSEFRRVELSDDSPRRGLLGKGSILTLTSYATRTSPVLRGKYILDNLLSAPPPPPPPNVPALAERASDGKQLSMRDAMAQHRANPVCASCHARMDPLGFAMENFDAVGQWRTRSESGEAIDASATLPDGTKFDGVAGLRDQLVKRSQQFVTGVTEKLLTFAVGRKSAYYDAPAIRKIVRDAGRNNYRFSSLVLGVVNSTAFQMRAGGQPEAVSTARN